MANATVVELNVMVFLDREAQEEEADRDPIIMRVTNAEIEDGYLYTYVTIPSISLEQFQELAKIDRQRGLRHALAKLGVEVDMS